MSANTKRQNVYRIHSPHTYSEKYFYGFSLQMTNNPNRLSRVEEFQDGG
jgi:hypothetical protein